jgi:GT2 family glycosyltransferase
MARGDFVALVDHDDELREHALYMVVAELNAYPDSDLVYSDEDKIDGKGRRYDPYFKSDWNPTLFLAQNFTSHLSVYRTQIVKDAGGFREGFEGAQDWDLAMRVIEAVPSSHIRHIPHVLYHWRAIRGSAALAMDEKNYTNEAQRKTLQSHFERLGTNVEILPAAETYWRIKYPLPEPPPSVTLIIPTRNGATLLRRCIEGIYQKTSYFNFELIVVDNQSNDPDTLNYLLELERRRGVRILRYDAPFNYSGINNFAVQHARGEIVGLLNNDLEVITPEWLEEMVSHAIQPGIGVVGAMLYYPNDTIQHAGVILGVGGVAGHAYCRQPRGYNGAASRAALCQNLSAVTAACLVVRREVFEKVGGLDETDLAIAFNDIDFCLRVRENGYRNVWTPYAEFYHYESATRGYEETPEKLDRFEKERDYMKQRWGELLLNDPAYNPNLALDRETFTLAFPPRITKPWLTAGPG